MSRTADPASCQRQATYPIVLLVITFCLLAHFLVEDVSFIQVMGVSSQNHSTAQMVFEMEHQDDLAIAASLPDTIPHNEPPAITTWIIRQERQTAFPILTPPKIV